MVTRNIFQVLNPAALFKNRVVPLDVTRRVAGALGKSVGSLLPPIPEEVAKEIGFPEYPYACQSFARVGRVGDGGKYICLDHMPLGKPGDCVVYSFGINFDFSFDKAMSILGCKVHSFDPFMLLKYPPSARGYIKMKAVPPMVQFHSIGLAGHDHRQEFYGERVDLKTLGTIGSQLNDRKIDILKIDIEGNEWDMLEKMVDEDFNNINVLQICIEVHLDEHLASPSKVKKTLEKLYHKGYDMWHREDNIDHSIFIQFNGFHVRSSYELSFIKNATL